MGPPNPERRHRTGLERLALPVVNDAPVENFIDLEGVQCVVWDFMGGAVWIDPPAARVALPCCRARLQDNSV